MNAQRFDIVGEVLEETLKVYPVSSFLIGLYKRYQQYGTLSKKQLQGLHAKAADSGAIPPGKLATLEALINKMPTRYRSGETIVKKPLFEKDPVVKELLEQILATFPDHKRALYLQAKYENNEPLKPNEISDLKNIHALLLKRSK